MLYLSLCSRNNYGSDDVNILCAIYPIWCCAASVRRVASNEEHLFVPHRHPVIASIHGCPSLWMFQRPKRASSVAFRFRTSTFLCNVAVPENSHLSCMFFLSMNEPLTSLKPTNKPRTIFFRRLRAFLNMIYFVSHFSTSGNHHWLRKFSVLFESVLVLNIWACSRYQPQQQLHLQF